MPEEKIPSRTGDAAGEFLWLAAVLWVVGGYLWPTLSPVEVPTLQAMLDPTLYRHDFVVQEYLRFTPRFYYNLLIYLPALAGLPLAWVCAGWQLIALGSLLMGLRALARALGIGAVGAAIFVLWALLVETGDLGLTYFYIASPAPGLWASALAVWGGVFAVRQRWRTAYWLFGAAALLQFLVGFYAGLLVLPALWRDRGLRALPSAVLGWVIGLAAVYLPMRLGGGTGGQDLTSREFVEIYARLRHPHHLVPTAWGWAAWMQAVVFYVGALACCRRLSPAMSASARWLLGGVLALTAAALAVNFIGVEAWPIALIAKLQPARTTPWAEIAMLAALGVVVQQRLAQRDFAGAVLLALAPFSPYPGFLLLLAAVLLANAKPGASWQVAVLAAATLLAFYQGSGITSLQVQFYGKALILFAALWAPVWLRRRAGWMPCAGGVALAGAVACAVLSTTPHWPRRLAAHFAVDVPPYEIFGQLGQRFGRLAPVDAVILIPPDAAVWSFKLYARRAIVVDQKHFPFTDRGMLEWQRRMDDILGQRFAPGLDIDAAWAAQSPARLASVAARYGARYVLTRDAWHATLPGRRVDRLGDWSIWELPTANGRE